MRVTALMLASTCLVGLGLASGPATAGQAQADSQRQVESLLSQRLQAERLTAQRQQAEQAQRRQVIPAQERRAREEAWPERQGYGGNPAAMAPPVGYPPPAYSQPPGDYPPPAYGPPPAAYGMPAYSMPDPGSSAEIDDEPPRGLENPAARKRR